MPPGIRLTRSITLGLVTGGLAALGYGAWDRHRNPNDPSGNSNNTYAYHNWHSTSSGSHSSFHSSGTSHGGFGSTGHASS